MTRIRGTLRQQVIARANRCCEYCHLHQRDHVLPFEADHIRSEKHGGNSSLDNLCWCCWDCNNAKGSDIASADPETGIATFLFHPRQQQWDDHFRIEGTQIVPLTPEGRVTVSLLQLNSEARLLDRVNLVALRRYPCR